MTADSVSLPIQVLLVEDHLVMSTALRLLLNSRPNLQVCGEAATHDAAHALAEKTPFDIVLLDLFLAEGNTLPLIPVFLAASPAARIIILTGTPDVIWHHQALSLGASGLVLKEQPAEILLKAIERVHAGEIWIDRSLFANVMTRQNTAPNDPTTTQIALLTSREREIVAAIGLGLKNKIIAEKLFISERTVHNHLASIFRKLEVSDRLELALFAGKHGLLENSD